MHSGPAAEKSQFISCRRELTCRGEKPQDREYDKTMASPKKKSAPANSAGKHAGSDERGIPGEISEMGKVLRRLAEKNVASGAKLLNRRELEREIAERRGLR